MMEKIIIIVTIVISFSLLGCKNDSSPNSVQDNHETLSPYQDVRWRDLQKFESQLNSSIIKTFVFNEKTVWPERYAAYSKSLIMKGKNPGLGIRELHQQGITGKGVAVAIIDQNICLDHPEFAEKIVEYHDVGCNKPSNQSSLHGPAVASLLVGGSIGTAPDAKLYFVAAPGWNQDAKYQADALNWIIAKNSSLPDGEKIRAVSISLSPSGPGTSFTKNTADWDSAYNHAVNAGILIIDCSDNHGITNFCFYDIDDPDNIGACTLGQPGEVFTYDPNRICIPVSLRTTAEQSIEGNFSYQFWGKAGLSWAEPYLVGVLALGWQVRPEISKDDMIRLVRMSAYVTKSGARIIQPKAFIDAVKAFRN
jgi:serine protease AprX